MDFKQSYFIGSGAYVKDFFDKQEEHFSSGEQVTIYTEAEDIDMTSYETQANMNAFIDKLKKCDGCSQQFTVPESFDSWYVQLKEFSQSMNGVPNGACTASWNDQKDAVVPEKFMGCLNFFLNSRGGQYARSINMNSDKSKITSFK